MKKITLLLVAICAFTFNSFSQVTIEVLAYPTEFALVSGTIYGPSEGQNPYVINLTNIPADLAIFSPIISATTLNTDFASGTIQSTGETPSRNGSGNIGTAVGLHSGTAPVDASGNPSSTKVINIVDNMDGTFNFTLIATRFNIGKTITPGEPYAPHFRYFSPVSKYFTSVALKSGSTTEYEVVGMTFNDSATAETEENLLATGTTLSTERFSKNELTSGFYKSSTQSIILDANLKGNFNIYNMLGQTVKTGEIENNIDVSSLKSGVYILSTKFGKLKFAK